MPSERDKSRFQFSVSGLLLFTLVCAAIAFAYRMFGELLVGVVLVGFIWGSPVVLICSWLYIRAAERMPGAFTKMWIGLTAAYAVMIAILMAIFPDDKNTEFPNFFGAILCAAIVFPPGPFLDVALRMDWNPTWVIPVTVVLVPLSVSACFVGLIILGL